MGVGGEKRAFGMENVTCGVPVEHAKCISVWSGSRWRRRRTA